MKTSILAENISKKYNGLQALSDVSFEVEKGELFGLIGPDGAGKTSLFRILATLLFADQGNARVEGYDVMKEYKKIRKIVGYMPGRFSLYFDLSVEENLKFYARIFNTNIKENYHLVKDIYQQIEPFKNRLAGRLSGGMKQKLALSCALIHSPNVLFLDEPTTGVDAVSRKEFWDMLKTLQKEGITILVSTPYMDEAALCDRVALMQKGNILSIDRPEEIVKSYQAELAGIRSSNMFDIVVDLHQFEETASVFRFGDNVHYTSISGHIDNEKIEDFLKSKDHDNIRIEKIKPSIEDCFMELMQEEKTENEG